jgi:hypothetical protein
MGGTNKEESMSESVFRELARALDRLANGFPQTESEIELRLLQKIFSSEEAGLSSGEWFCSKTGRDRLIFDWPHS